MLPGCGVIVPRAHRASPFDFTDEEWAATHELLLEAKAAWDERLAPDGYMLVWNCSPDVGHAHLHVVPRFDDEPLAHEGGRSAVKAPENRRPDPTARGGGRARLFGRRTDLSGRAPSVYPFLTFRSTAAHPGSEYFGAV